MYEADSPGVVQEVSKLFNHDARVSQFYDPEKLVSKEVLAGMGIDTSEVAWDVYLFYDTQAKWTDTLPPPKDWVHQLEGGDWADPSRLFLGNLLTGKLREITMNILQNSTHE